MLSASPPAGLDQRKDVSQGVRRLLADGVAEHRERAWIERALARDKDEVARPQRRRVPPVPPEARSDMIGCSGLMCALLLDVDIGTTLR